MINFLQSRQKILSPRLQAGNIYIYIIFQFQFYNIRSINYPNIPEDANPSSHYPHRSYGYTEKKKWVNQFDSLDEPSLSPKNW